MYASIVCNYVKYLENEEGDRKDEERFVDNQKEFHFTVMKIKQLKS